MHGCKRILFSVCISLFLSDSFTDVKSCIFFWQMPFCLRESESLSLTCDFCVPVVFCPCSDFTQWSWKCWGSANALCVSSSMEEANDPGSV